MQSTITAALLGKSIDVLGSVCLLGSDNSTREIALLLLPVG